MKIRFDTTALHAMFAFQAYPWICISICRKHVQGIEHVFASNNPGPGKRVHPPNTLDAPVPRVTHVVMLIHNCRQTNAPVFE